MAVLLVQNPASAALIATHRVGPGDTIGDALQCRNQETTYFGTGTSTSIKVTKIEIRNNSGSTTIFGGEIREENGGKVWYLPGFSMGPKPGTKTILVNQSFRYSHNAGFKLTIRSTNWGCGGREESIRFLSH